MTARHRAPWAGTVADDVLALRRLAPLENSLRIRGKEMSKYTATYSAEDNKLRLYVGRVPRDEYEALRKEGWASTPKQDCDFVATWTPGREDTALSYLADDEDIGDEDYSPEERAADRAERFEEYRDKRAAEAGGLADRFEAGPSAFGHQNRARAERQARRHDRLRVHAVSQWSKAEYWQERTKGVIAHALYRSSAPVRRGRIKKLEAELRSVIASYTPQDNPPSIINQQAYDWTTGQYKYDGAPVPHVWVGPKGRGGSWVELSSLEAIKRGSARWVAHYELRLAYERAMLEAEGGAASNAEMEPGGWIGKYQIQKVNKSNTTGRVVSVVILAPKGSWGSRRGHLREGEGAKLVPCLLNIERMGEEVYRAPTDEERAEFIRATAERKAEEKAKAPPVAPLINPTDEDAERLQALWNSWGEASHKKHSRFGDYKPSTVLRLTQAEYSARSKGTYSHYETADITERLKIKRRSTMGRDLAGRVVVFKIRIAPTNEMSYAPKRVIILTDKPQKPIPWEAAEVVAEGQPSEEKMRSKLPELAAALALNWLPESGMPESKLIDDGVYLGWCFVSSMSQFGWTEEGARIFKESLSKPEPVEEQAERVPAGLLF